MLVKVEMEVDEMARGLSEPYLEPRSGRINVDFVQGVITKIDKSKKYVRLQNYNSEIPFHRINEYTFGGILVDNKEYDQDRIMQENADMAKKIQKTYKKVP